MSLKRNEIVMKTADTNCDTQRSILIIKIFNGKLLVTKQQINLYVISGILS